MGAAISTGGRPYHGTRTDRRRAPPKSRGYQPPPAYIEATLPQHTPAGDSATTEEAVRDNIVAELRQVTRVIQKGHHAGDVKPHLHLQLQALLTIEGGIVVMADQKITPPQHHAYIVALNALTRWGNDQKRSLYTVKGHCYAVTEHDEGRG
jgi:hypothetical protein